MDLPKNYSKEARNAVTLAVLAYTNSGDTAFQIRHALEEVLGQEGTPGPWIHELPTGQNWKIVWGPMISTTQDMSFVVHDVQNDTYAFVIRGTAKNFFDAIQNLEVDLIPIDPTWVSGENASGIMVSKGASNGVKKELCLPSTLDEDQVNGQPTTALQYLRSVRPGRLLVTGHSQGGTDTQLAAVALHALLEGTEVVPYGFAGLSAGHDAFATYYEKLFAGRETRFFNTLDLAWRPWQVDTLEEIRHLYHKSDNYDPPKPTLLEKFILQLAINKVKNANYRQPQQGVALPGKLYIETKFYLEAGAQHNHLYYLDLMGVNVETLTREYPFGVFSQPWSRPPTPAPTQRVKIPFSRRLIQFLKFLLGIRKSVDEKIPTCH